MDEECLNNHPELKTFRRELRSTMTPFEAVMMRENRTKGFFVSFDFTRDALSEIQAFFVRTGKSIVALTVQDILNEHIAHRLA